MATRSAEDVLGAIEETEIDDEVDRVLSMTPDERRHEFAVAGGDLSKLEAKADAWLRRSERPDPAPRRAQAIAVEPERVSLPPWVTARRIALGTMLVVAAIVLLLLLDARRDRPQPTLAAPSTEEPSSAPGAPTAPPAPAPSSVEPRPLEPVHGGDKPSRR